MPLPPGLPGHRSTAGGVGVENLSGSGLIAGETSRACDRGPGNATPQCHFSRSGVRERLPTSLTRKSNEKCRSTARYDETFTLSYVTGRSVGIGAYLHPPATHSILTVLKRSLSWIFRTALALP